MCFLESQMNNNKKLIAALEYFRDKEASKPVEEMDHEYVSELVALLLELQEKHVTLTTQEINEKVRKIPFVKTDASGELSVNKGNGKHINKKRVLLVAACIALLLALLCFISVATNNAFYQFFKDKFGTVINARERVEYQVDGVSVMCYDEIVVYDSLEEAYKAQSLDVLLPGYMPHGTAVGRIYIEEDNNGRYVYMQTNNNEMISLDIALEKELPAELVSNVEPVTIKDRLCYINHMADVGIYQAMFSYNGDVYTINCPDEQELLKIIENLRE